MKFGYARISTDDQTTTLQLAALKYPGVAMQRVDRIGDASGKTSAYWAYAGGHRSSGHDSERENMADRAPPLAVTADQFAVFVIRLAEVAPVQHTVGGLQFCCTRALNDP
jgi:hypothetical protein